MFTKATREPIIHFAPLQGYTDTEYREVFFKTIGNVDQYYTPYLSLENNGSVRAISRILANEGHLHKELLVPQILPGSIDELIRLTTIVVEAGYQSMNINLGCPYPMVTKRGRGAALLKDPLLVNSLLKHLSTHFSLEVSLKMRIGMEQSDEVFSFLDQIDHSLVKAIIIHPRTAKQLYKGKADPFIFAGCKERYTHTNLIYNGDIDSKETFERLCELFPDQNEWMVGRGLIANPLLAKELKTGIQLSPLEKRELLLKFCLELYNAIGQSSNDKCHALNRIRLQLLAIFENCADKKKIIKQLKKAREFREVESLCYQLV
jgi:tRNA-dihydrouridine synthase